MGRLRGGFDSFLRVAKGHRKPKSTLLAAYTRFFGGFGDAFRMESVGAYKG